MLNNNVRVEPSAPPINGVPYNNNGYSPYPAMSKPPLPQSMPITAPQPGLNVPPMMYSVPGAVQQQPLPMQAAPAAALKPMTQSPPAPALNEISLNEERQRVRCPYCYSSIVTNINYKTGVMTHIAAFAVFVVCCPLFFVPYCVDCCKDVEHACPSCGRRIGQFKRFT